MQLKNIGIAIIALIIVILLFGFLWRLVMGAIKFIIFLAVAYIVYLYLKKKL